jgi:uncharacterized protein YegP (UPF0339 family)
MYTLMLYQLPKSERWRWKLVTPNGRVIARADYHYQSMSRAERSFKGMLKGLINNPISVSIIKSDGVTYWHDLGLVPQE